VIASVREWYAPKEADPFVKANMLTAKTRKPTMTLTARPTVGLKLNWA
jgi:hypothetical protein